MVLLRIFTLGLVLALPMKMKWSRPHYILSARTRWFSESTYTFSTRNNLSVPTSTFFVSDNRTCPTSPPLCRHIVTMNVVMPVYIVSIPMYICTVTRPVIETFLWKIYQFLSHSSLAFSLYSVSNVITNWARNLYLHSAVSQYFSSSNFTLPRDGICGSR